MHAYQNPIRVYELEEGFTMLIGGDVTAALYEIGVIDATTGPVVVHAMSARDKFLG